MTATDRRRSPFTATAVEERSAVYAELAAGGTVHRTQLPHGEPAWLVTGYDEVRAAFADPRLVKGGPPPVVPGQPLPADVHRAMMSDLLHLDPPDHTRLRRLVSSAFTRRRVDDLAPRIEQIADELLDGILGADAPAEIDLIATYAFPLPMTVLGELLGIPADDAPAFHGWSTTLVSGSLAPVPEWVQAATSLIGFVRDLLDRRRREPAGDLLGALVAARDGADRLSEDELTSMVFLLLLAGQETTVNLIANGTLTLLRHPAALAAVRADPAAALPAAVEEVLRFEGPVQVATPRIATAPMEIGGTSIAPGDVVVLSVMAANRDPRRPGADVFDPGRTPPLPHTAFGHGVHHCLGAPLARLEGRIALERLLLRCPGLRLATAPDRLLLRPSMLMHGLTALPVTVSAPSPGTGVPIVDPSNREQARTWDGPQGATWATEAERFDTSVSGYREAFRAAAAVPAGSTVLDVGCGSGQTTRDAVRDGAASALGVDLSSRLIALAGELARREGLTGARFLRTDAQVHPFDEASFDLVISRTGTMFFGDPPAAFANLARATRPGGRLVQLVWGPLAANEWLPALVRALGDRALPDRPPDGPGPFSLSDPDRVRGLLTTAGYRDVRLEQVSAPMVLGRDPDEAERYVLGFLGWLLDGVDDAGRAKALARLRASLHAHRVGDRVAYGSTAWLVTARRP